MSAEEQISHPLDDDPAVASAAATPPPFPAAAPRLSIMHLLIWTTTSAAMMAFYNLVMSLQRSSTHESAAEMLRTPVMMTLQTLWAMGMGAYLGGALMFVSRRLRGMRFPVQPGEWLMVTFGIGTVINLFVYLAVMAAVDRDRSGMHWFFIFHSARQLVHSAEFLIPALLCKDRLAWRAFFWVSAIVSLLSLGLVLVGFIDEMSFFRIFQPGIFRWFFLGLCALIFLLAVVGDLRRRTPRGWVHWVGVASMAVLFVSNEAYYIYMIIFANRA
jgi:hypothetical protein